MSNNFDNSSQRLNFPSVQLISDGPGTHSFHKAMTPAVERYIDWEDGMPVLKYRNLVKKEAANSLKLHALSQPYEGEWDALFQCYLVDPRFEGMTKAEVIEHKMVDKAASGNIEAAKEIQDRLCGKAKQQVESKNLNMSYENFLEEIARQEELNGNSESQHLDI